MAFIREEKFLGLDMLRFGAGGYEALIVPAVGANVIELSNVEKGVSVLRKPSEDMSVEAFRARPQVYGLPVLFTPNRIADGTFTMNGKTYHFPKNDGLKANHIHGFLHTRPWEITKKEINGEMIVVEATFVCTEKTDFFVNFPHEFVFSLQYTLSATGLEQEIKIKNNSDSKMPIGLGFHTSIQIPFCNGGKQDDYIVRCSIGKKWPLVDMYPQAAPVALPEEDAAFAKEGVKAVGHVLDGLHFVNAPMQYNGKSFLGAVITDAVTNVSVIYEWDKKFKHSVIWNDSGDKNYVCPEPQSWAINAPNLPYGDEVTGAVSIDPGTAWESVCKMYIS